MNSLKAESNRIGRRVNMIQESFGSLKSVRLVQFVLAVFCTEMNSVASIMPVPSGVGIVIL